MLFCVARVKRAPHVDELSVRGVARGKGLHSSSQLRACVLRVHGCERAYVLPSPGRACVRAARALEHHLSVPAHNRTESHGGATHTQLINLAASERSTQDARCLGLAGFDPEARARAAPKRGRQSARPTRLARGVAATPTKKAAKIMNTLSAQKKGGLPGEKSGAREAEKSS